MILVDVGWIGRMQQGIDVLFDDVSTIGYYIGIYDNLLDPPFDIERKGLIFNKNNNGEKSEFFDLFRANIQIYEQLLAAPHGSACYYRIENGKPVVMTEWDSQEEKLYKECIFDIQCRMLRYFKYICTLVFGDNKKSNKELALIVLRSAMLQSDERLAFMKRLNTGFSQNFQQQTVGLEFNPAGLEINPIRVITNPQEYVRYFAKLGVVLDKKNLAIIRKPINGAMYWYIRFREHI
jgi:hypothetical protein